MTGSQEDRDRHRQVLALERIAKLLENLSENFAKFAAVANKGTVVTENYTPPEGYAGGLGEAFRTPYGKPSE